MPTSALTVQALSTALALMRQELNDVKALLMDTLRQMLTISQTQAETSRELTDITRTLLTTTLQVGPGASYARSDAQDYQDWRRAEDRPEDEPLRELGD